MEINDVLKEGFKKWLQTLHYAESTVYGSVRYVDDFFCYLKTNEINSLEEIQPVTINNYHKHLQQRKNKKQAGSLSNNYIISNINALKRFGKYLQLTEKASLDINIQIRPGPVQSKTILTQSEIQALYKACSNDYLGTRDRAILSVYYGCGLRRSEGLALNISDILLKEKRIYVRKGKNYRERYVPMTESVKKDLENYIYVARKKILSFKNVKPEALFLSMQVKRLCGNALIKRIHKLATEAKIQKETGLHCLRHSIATHLLQSGMELEEISQFLGHASLESTQIYTRITNE